MTVVSPGLAQLLVLGRRKLFETASHPLVLRLRVPQPFLETVELLPKTSVEPFGSLMFRRTHTASPLTRSLRAKRK